MVQRRRNVISTTARRRSPIWRLFIVAGAVLVLAAVFARMARRVEAGAGAAQAIVHGGGQARPSTQ